MNETKFYGIISILFVVIAIFIGVIGIINESFEGAFIYFAILVISPIGILVTYCTKCQCAEKDCAHILPGLVVKMLPKRVQTEYSLLDYVILLVCFLLLLIFPQFWLINNFLFFISFWILVIIGVTIIIMKVCPSCKNNNCYICTHFSNRHK